MIKKTFKDNEVSPFLELLTKKYGGVMGHGVYLFKEGSPPQTLFVSNKMDIVKQFKELDVAMQALANFGNFTKVGDGTLFGYYLANSNGDTIGVDLLIVK